MAEPPAPDPKRDPLAPLRRLTEARIGLPRAGIALATPPLLDFQLAHARARDAVHAELDAEAIATKLGMFSIAVASAAPDRATYLRRPDLGRRLAEETSALPPGPCDLAIVIADGLSATAVHAEAVAVTTALATLLADWRIAPIVIARHARVALGDVVGAGLGAAAVAVLIGERPGLSSAASLGAYLTLAPRPGRRDSERNCVSNIRTPGGLPADKAAEKIAWLLREARRIGATGVALKDRHGERALE